MSIAVLGASGFIGSRVAEALIKSGHEVLVVASREPKTSERRATWDMAAHRSIADLRTNHIDLLGCQTVYNFAADMGGVGYFSEAQVGPYISNSRITFNVLEMCRAQDVSRVFMASSACAYPITSQMTENVTPLLTEDLLESGPPDQMYGREKLMICALARHLPYDCRVGVLHTVFGDVHSVDESRMKFPTAIVRKVLAARKSSKVEIWGNGNQRRSFLWIDDAVKKILRVMEGPNPGPINIGFQGAISILEAVKICSDYLGISPQLIFDNQRPSGVLSRDCSNEKFWRIYGPMEPTNTILGFQKMIDQMEEMRSPR